MKKRMLFILALIVFVTSVHAEDVAVKGLVNDYANVIQPAEKAQIEQVLQAIMDSGAAEYSIVTVNDLGGKDIESYSLDLAQGKLGNSETNNGLLLLVAINDRKYRFEVGRGLESKLNDAKVGRIGRTYLAPNFQDESYGKGILEASLAVKSILLGETNSSYYVPETKTASMNSSAIIFFLILFFIITSTLSRLSASKKKKDNYFGAAMTALWLFGGRGGGGRGGSGGFGGFGGGSFGGGGASGGW